MTTDGVLKVTTCKRKPMHSLDTFWMTNLACWSLFHSIRSSKFAAKIETTDSKRTELYMLHMLHFVIDNTHQFTFGNDI